MCISLSTSRGTLPQAPLAKHEVCTVLGDRYTLQKRICVCEKVCVSMWMSMCVCVTNPFGLVCSSRFVCGCACALPVWSVFVRVRECVCVSCECVCVCMCVCVLMNG